MSYTWNFVAMDLINTGSDDVFDRTEVRGGRETAILGFTH